MQMLYNSDQFAVVVFDTTDGDAALELAKARQQQADAAVDAPQEAQASTEVATEADAPVAANPAPQALRRGGFEIVDKFARKEIFLEGALAERFHEGVRAIVNEGPTEEKLDDYIAGFAVLASQPVVLH